jgi:hypothetical protein
VVRRRVPPRERMRDTWQHLTRKDAGACNARQAQRTLPPCAQAQSDKTAQGRRIMAGGAARVLDDGSANLPPHPTVATCHTCSSSLW